MMARRQHWAGHPPSCPGQQGGPRERLRSGCSGSGAATGLQGPQSSRTPPCRDSRPVTGHPPRRCCCRYHCYCRCWSCHCCTGPRRWRSRSGAALRRDASGQELGDGGQQGSGRQSWCCSPDSKDSEARGARPKPLLAPALTQLRCSCAQPRPGAYMLVGLITVPQDGDVPKSGCYCTGSVRTWVS